MLSLFLHNFNDKLYHVNSGDKKVHHKALKLQEMSIMTGNLVLMTGNLVLILLTVF